MRHFAVTILCILTTTFTAWSSESLACNETDLPPGVTSKCLPPNPNHDNAQPQLQRPACEFTYSRPRIIDFQNQKTCVALIKCQDTGGVITSICPALSETSCPDAVTCKADNTMHQLPGQVLSAFCIDSEGYNLPDCTPAGVIVP
jgi:hypothetical protein